jgi:hypothetical protein
MLIEQLLLALCQSSLEKCAASGGGGNMWAGTPRTPAGGLAALLHLPPEHLCLNVDSLLGAPISII